MYFHFFCHSFKLVYFGQLLFDVIIYWLCLKHSHHFSHTNAAVNLSVCVCSYRFMDMFPDAALVRDIQLELDDIIQQGVQNITRLIKATDPTITGPLQTQGRRGDNTGTASSNNLTSRKGQRAQRDPGEMMDSSLASRLVRDGLLTPDLLRQLQREWSKDHKQEFTSQSALDTEHLNNDNKGKKKKKKK